MKYYSYSVSRKKLPFKILLIFVFVLLVIAASILLGNYLKNKTDAMGDVLDSAGNTADDTELNTEKENENLTENSGGDPLSALKQQKIPVSANARGACVEILRSNGEIDAEQMSGQLQSLPEKWYNTVSLPLTAADGTLLYRSDAVQQAVRDGDESVSDDIKALRDVVVDAHLLLMRVSGVYVMPDYEDPLAFSAALAYDALIWRELSEKTGLDEIVLVMGNQDMEASFDRLALIAETMRNAAPELAFGIAFAGEAFESLAAAQTLEKLSEIVDFLALDLSDRVETAVKNSGNAFETANSVLQNLKGSIAFYSFRILLSGYDQPIRDGQMDALTANSVGNYQFISAGDDSGTD